MKGNERKDQALGGEPSTVIRMKPSRGENANLEVLNKVVEDAKTLRILAILNVNQRTDLGGLKRGKKIDG